MNTKNFKDEKRAHLFRALSLPKTTRAIVLLSFEESEIIDFLSRACDAIGVKAISGEFSLEMLDGADAIISDGKNVDIKKLLPHVLVPIVTENIAKKYGLSEFNPMKFEGNAFLFEDPKNGFQIFEKIVRFLENIRYPGDKRTLLQNITKTFE
jgi:hypothetical protein